MTAGHKGPHAAQRLAQGPHLDIDLLGQAEFFNQAAAVRPEHAGGVRLINHHPGVVLPGQGSNLSQWGQVTVHAEHAVCHNQALACRWTRVQQFVQMSRVSVTIDADVSPRQAAAVNDTGVIEAVAQDRIARPHESRQHPDIGVIARRKNESRFRFFEPGEAVFQLVMDGH